MSQDESASDPDSEPEAGDNGSDKATCNTQPEEPDDGLDKPDDSTSNDLDDEEENERPRATLLPHPCTDIVTCCYPKSYSFFQILVFFIFVPEFTFGRLFMFGRV